MADQEVFYLYGVRAGGPDLTPNMVHQTRSQRLNPAISLSREGRGGHVYDNFVAIGSGQPALNFSTTAIATALNTLGDIEGWKIDVNPLQMFWYQGEQGGTRLTGADHVMMAVTKGLVVPTTLRAPQNPPAQIDYNVMARLDAGNSPVIITKGVAVPDVTLDGEEFTAGPFIVNGVDLSDGVEDITLNFGISLETRSDQSTPWLRYVGIRRTVPTISVRFTNQEYIADIGIPGQKITADVLTYFRKMEEGGTRVPDITPEHIETAVEGGIVVIGDASASDPNPAVASLQVNPRLVDGSPMIGFNTTSALP